MDRLIVVKTFFHKHDAQMAQGLLNEKGIESIVSADDCGGFRPDVTLGMGNVKLLVQQKDEEHAQEILKVLDLEINEDELNDEFEKS